MGGPHPCYERLRPDPTPSALSLLDRAERGSGAPGVSGGVGRSSSAVRPDGDADAVAGPVRERPVLRRLGHDAAAGVQGRGEPRLAPAPWRPTRPRASRGAAAWPRRAPASTPSSHARAGRRRCRATSAHSRARHARSRGRPRPASRRWPAGPPGRVSGSGVAPADRATAEIARARSAWCASSCHMSRVSRTVSREPAIVSTAPTSATSGTSAIACGQAGGVGHRADAKGRRRPAMEDDPVVDAVRGEERPPARLAHVASGGRGSNTTTAVSRDRRAA